MVASSLQLLTIMAFLPGFLVGAFLGLLEAGVHMPGPLGAFLRFARIAVKGLVMTLYYDDPGVLHKLEYEVNVYTADIDQPVHGSAPAGG